MKKILLLAAAMFLGITAKAQTEECRNKIVTVFFDDLEYAAQNKAEISELAAGQSFLSGKMKMGNSSPHSKDVNLAVCAAIGESNRLRLSNFDEEYRLSGNITDISFEKRDRFEEYKDKNGNVKRDKKTDHFATVSIMLILSCTANGQEWKSPFTARTGWGERNPNEREALENVLMDLRRQIVRFLNTSFPIQANVVERGKAKKDKMQQLYIDFGLAESAREGMSFRVNEIGEVAGKPTHQKIGEVTVSEVQGDSISLCKVTRGGKEIKTAMDEGKTLSVTLLE